MEILKKLQHTKFEKREIRSTIDFNVNPSHHCGDITTQKSAGECH